VSSHHRSELGGGRRSHLGIIADILSEALGDANKTRIMYRANLNFLRAKKYFDELSKMGLMEKVNSVDGGIVYRTTERGRELLRALKKVEDFADL